MRLSQPDIEHEINDLIPNGLKREISKRTGIYPTVIYGYFNPEDERKSPFYETLFIQHVLDEIDPAIGAAVWEKVNELRELGRTTENRTQCLNAEIAKATKEANDIAIGKLNDRPLYELLAEAVENEAQAKRTKQAILDAINAEKEQTNGHKARLRRAV